jgi:hypothetical protein
VLLVLVVATVAVLARLFVRFGLMTRLAVLLAAPACLVLLLVAVLIRLVLLLIAL